MKGERALICAWAVVLCACGALDSISETKNEVKKSNANIARLVEQGDVVGKKLDQNISEVKKSNKNMGALIDQGAIVVTLLRESIKAVQSSLTQMNKLVTQGDSTRSQLEASVKAVEASLAKMDQLATLSQKIGDLTGDVKSEIASNLIEVRRTRTASEKILENSKQTLEKIKEGEDAAILQTIQTLGSVVNDITFESRYRVASARAVWELLIKHPDARWYARVTSLFQMCRERAGNAYGDVCTFKMVGIRGQIVQGLHDFRIWVEKKIPPMILPFVEHFVAATPFDPDNLPIAPFSPNMVWVLGLSTGAIAPFHKYLVADDRNPLFEPAAAFLQFAKKVLLDSIADLKWDEMKGKSLPPYKQEAMEFRQRIVDAIDATERAGEASTAKFP